MAELKLAKKLPPDPLFLFWDPSEQLKQQARRLMPPKLAPEFLVVEDYKAARHQLVARRMVPFTSGCYCSKLVSTKSLLNAAKLYKLDLVLVAPMSVPKSMSNVSRLLKRFQYAASYPQEYLEQHLLQCDRIATMWRELHHLSLGVLTSAGAKVREVYPGSAAERANVAPGDEILSIGPTAVRTRQDVANAAELSAGQLVTMRLRREGTEYEFQIQLDP